MWLRRGTAEIVRKNSANNLAGPRQTVRQIWSSATPGPVADSPGEICRSRNAAAIDIRADVPRRMPGSGGKHLPGILRRKDIRSTDGGNVRLAPVAAPVCCGTV